MNRRIVVQALVAVVAGCGCGSDLPRVAHPDRGMPDAPADDAPGPIPVVELRNPDSRIVTVRVVFSAGSSDDPAGREGATLLAAKLQTEGGTRELGYTELVARLFPMAGEISAAVERDQTVLLGRVHREKLEPFYDLLRDVLVEPRMGEEDFRRLREEAKSALTLELRGNDDEELGKEALQAAIYAGHPYGHPTLGTETGLDALSLEDVRRQRDAVLCRRRVTLGLAGGYPEGFAARVVADLESLPTDRCAAPAALPEPPAIARNEVLLVDKPEATSTAISIGFPVRIGRAHEDFAALQLATAYLGQHRQFAGVLFKKLRAARGLNYGDYAYAEHFEQDGWSRFARPNVSRRQQYWSIWIRPVEPQNAHFALRAAVRELHRLARDGPSDADFEKTRGFLDRYVGLFEMTESRRLGNRLDDRFYGLAAPLLEGLRARWREIDANVVRRVVREHLDRPMRIAIVHREASALAGAMASDATSPIEYREPKPDDVLAEDREIQSYALGIARDAIRIVPVREMFR